jgi:photosystem II stability/assembly factor-like uncharacterized protein
MPVIDKIFKTGQGRVFAQWNGGAPDHAVEYMGLARMTGLSESLGDVTPIRAPSQASYSAYDVVDYIRGEPGLPTTSMIARFGYVNRILHQVCPFDVHVHYGTCRSPNDFINGWDKALCFEGALITTRSSDDLSPMEGTEAVINFTGEITALKFWEYDPMTLGEKADAIIETEIVAVVVSDYISCGECGYESDGNKRIFAVQKGSGGSPGILSELFYSVDGGINWDEEVVDTLGQAEPAADLAIVGNYIVVVSGAVASLSYATIAAPGTWTEVTTGFVAAKYPNAIFSLASSMTWLAAEDGYIYFSDDITQGVEVQNSAGADLLCIHGVDSRNLIAGGESGLLLVTGNGGAVWSVSVAPGAISTINCVWMRTEHCWLVGGVEGGAGVLYYTTDGGTTWTQITFPVTAPTVVTDIAFADHADSPFGFMTVKTAAAGYLLRSIDGGKTWYQLPDGVGSMPTNAGLNSVSVGNSASFCVAGGLKGATDGIIIVAS